VRETLTNNAQKLVSGHDWHALVRNNYGNTAGFELFQSFVRRAAGYRWNADRFKRPRQNRAVPTLVVNYDDDPSG
jgi:hypothetical protein